MSELDLGGSPSAPGPSQTSPAQAGLLLLEPPAPVAVVKPEQAAGSVPIDPAKQTELQTRAHAFADELASLDARSPEFSKKVESITSMGDKDMRASASVVQPHARAAGRDRERRAGATAVATHRPAWPTRWSTCESPSPSSTPTGPTSPG